MYMCFIKATVYLSRTLRIIMNRVQIRRVRSIMHTPQFFLRYNDLVQITIMAYLNIYTGYIKTIIYSNSRDFCTILKSRVVSCSRYTNFSKRIGQNTKLCVVTRKTTNPLCKVAITTTTTLDDNMMWVTCSVYIRKTESSSDVYIYLEISNKTLRGRSYTYNYRHCIDYYYCIFVKYKYILIKTFVPKNITYSVSPIDSLYTH